MFLLKSVRKSSVRIAKIRPFKIQAPLGSRSYQHLGTRCYYYAYTVKTTNRRTFSLYFVNKLFLCHDCVFVMGSGKRRPFNCKAMKAATFQHHRARIVGLVDEYVFHGIKHLFRFRPRASGDSQIDRE